MPRKHLIASGINKKQQSQAKVWMKLAKEIKAAAKLGDNPEANPRLKAAIARGLAHNLSRDSIEKNIKGAKKDTDNLKELTYEGYGPNGLAIIVKTLTDNEQRTISALRGYFSKLKGQISKPNSVMMLFEELGQFIIKKTKTEDEILEATLDFNVVDLTSDETAFNLLVDKNDFFLVKEKLESLDFPIYSSEIKLISNSLVDISEEEDQRLDKFIETCENDDDVQWVVTNLGEII